MKCENCDGTVDVSHEFEIVEMPVGGYQLLEFRVAECDCVRYVVDRTGYRIPDLPSEWTGATTLENAEQKFAIDYKALEAPENDED